MDDTQVVPPAASNSNPVATASPTNELGSPTQPPAPTNELGQQMPQQAPQQQAAPSMDHDTLFGKAAKMLMGNNTSYSVGPDGKTVTTQTPNTAGSFFKNILAAAVLGGAAGANSNGSFAQGAAQGGAAAVANNQKQDLIKRQQAQEDFKNSQEADRTTQQKMLTDATVANMHSEMASRQMHNDMESQEQHERHNVAAGAMEDNLLKAGGVPGQIQIDGKLTNTMTAPALADAISKDPSVMKAPDGYTRHFVDTADLSDITFNGVHWQDASGKPVNMTDRTTVKAFDVPDNALTKKIETSGKAYNAARGQNLLDPNKNYPISPSDMADANVHRLAEDKQQAMIDLENKKANMQGMELKLQSARLAHEFNNERKAEYSGAARMIGENIKALQAQAKDPMIDPKLKAHLNDQINQSLGNLKKYYDKAYPGMNIGDLAVDNNAAPVEPPTMMLNPQGQQVSVPHEKMAAALQHGYTAQGSAAAAPGLDQFDQGTTAVQDPKSGQTFAVPDDGVENFLKQAPGSKVIGKGTREVNGTIGNSIRNFFSSNNDSSNPTSK